MVISDSAAMNRPEEPSILHLHQSKSMIDDDDDDTVIIIIINSLNM